MSNNILLDVKDITKSFGGLSALDNVSFDIKKTEILGLIGPNGAGKSVSVNTITGMYRPTGGKIFFKGEDITGLRPDIIVRKGINRTFQLSNLFFNLSVMDNIMIGLSEITKVGLIGALLGTSSYRMKERKMAGKCEGILDLLSLGSYKSERVGVLPYGLQKVVSIGIAIAGDPELLILDEPLTGLIATEVDDVMGHIRTVNKQGISVMIIEHNMRAVMGTCNRIVVLKFGRKIAEGTPAEIKTNKEVIESYLGA